MIIDEGGQDGATQQNQLDLSLTKRLFSRLHPDALSNPPIIPIPPDFEREYQGYIVPTQDQVIKVLLDAILSDAAGTQALVSIVRGLIPRAT
jgi:hypothetical protein